MSIPELRWVPILVGAAAYLVLGEVWYSPPMLQHVWRQWIPDLGRPRQCIRDRAESAVYTVVMSWLIWLLLNVAQVKSFGFGMLVGAGVLIAAKALSSLTYARHQDIGTRAWWLFSVYQCMALAGVGGILTIWH